MRHVFSFVLTLLLANVVESNPILLDTESDEAILEQLELVEANETGELVSLL
jgi:hypothetical protein